MLEDTSLDNLEPPSLTTPLISLPAIAIDTETTGLDPRHARIVQIALMRINGGQLDREQTWHRLVNPGVPIPDKAAAVHGIRDDEVSDAHVFSRAWADAETFIGPRVLIGYRTIFDISVLKRECALAGLDWRERPWLCVQTLSRLVLSENLAVDSLETLADWLGVSIHDRHSALGDAEAAAAIWVALIPLLRQKGIRTLGEALEASGDRSEADAPPAQSPAAQSVIDGATPEHEKPPLRVDSYAYRHRIADVMSAPPVCAPAEMPLREAARLLVDKGVSSLVVEDEGRTGIVTERDVLRGVAAETPESGHTKLGAIMSHPLHTMHEAMHLYSAIGRMNRLGIRHLAAADANGAIVGMLTPRDLLLSRATRSLVLSDEIASAIDGADLARARAKLPLLARGLMNDAMDAGGIASVISAELCNLTRRAAQIGEERMVAAGMGKPPVPYALMVLASGGRGESLLAPDQDNAIIYERGDPGGAEDDWFALLGTHIADLLDEAGIPYCEAGVMAKNAPWRRSRDGWRAAVDEWIQLSRRDDLRDVDFFFDGVPVYGEARFAEDVLCYARERASRSPAFLSGLAELASDAPSPLGVLGGFRDDRDGRTNLKAGGLRPIAAAARVLAIRHELSARGTPERLKAAAVAGAISRTVADNANDAHETIMRVILTQQLEDIDNGVPLSALVETARLGQREQQALRQAIRDIDPLMEAVAED